MEINNIAYINMLPDELILEIYKELNIESFIALCQSSVRLQKLSDWKQLYGKYYRDSHMDTLLPTLSVLQTFKYLVSLCYSLTQLIKKLNLKHSLIELYQLK